MNAFAQPAPRLSVANKSPKPACSVVALIACLLLGACAGIPTIQEKPLTAAEKRLLGTWTTTYDTKSNEKLNILLQLRPNRDMEVFFEIDGNTAHSGGRWMATADTLTWRSNFEEQRYNYMSKYGWIRDGIFGEKTILSGGLPIKAQQESRVERLSTTTTKPTTRIYAEIQARRKNRGGNTDYTDAFVKFLFGAIVSDTFSGPKPRGDGVECEHCYGRGWTQPLMHTCIHCGGDGIRGGGPQ